MRLSAMVVNLIFLILLASSVNATITFDEWVNADYIMYYDQSAGSYTNRSYYGGDLFPDNADVDDCVMFGTYTSGASDSAQPFHDFNLGVRTPADANILIVDWQYHKDGAWTTIPNLTDDSNGFQKITNGEMRVTFPYPEKFRGNSSSIWLGSTLNSRRASWIRACITVVDNLREGGAMDYYHYPKVKDYSIRVENDSYFTAEDLFNASEAGDWNAVEHYDGTKIYYIKTSLKLINADFYTTRELIQIGNDDNIMAVNVDSSSSWNMGTVDADFQGHDGSCLYMGTGTTYGYSNWYNTRVYASLFIRPNGGFNMATQVGYPDWRNSIFNSDQTLYFPSGMIDGNFIYSYFDSDYYWYIYDDSLAVTGTRMTSTCDGLLMGTGEAVARDVPFTSIQWLNRYYASRDTCIDCIINPEQIRSSSPNTRDVWVDLNATLNITVRDDNGHTSEGANIYITDNMGRIVADVNTNSEGESGEIMLQWHRAEWLLSESWSTRHDYAYNPYTVTISKLGQVPYSGDFNITRKSEWQVNLGPMDTNGTIIVRRDLESLFFPN